MARASRGKLGLAAAGVALLGVMIWLVSNMFAFHDRWDAQDESNFWCLTTILPSIPNGDGWVVTAHRTDCDIIAKDSETYVYLHPADQPDRSYSLILRYDGDEPVVRWTDPHNVRITAQHVSDIDKQVVRLWNVTIAYDLQASASLPSTESWLSVK